MLVIKLTNKTNREFNEIDTKQHILKSYNSALNNLSWNFEIEMNASNPKTLQLIMALFKTKEIDTNLCKIITDDKGEVDLSKLK